MSKKRLNITVDPEVAERARLYSERHDTSISSLVEGFLSTLPSEARGTVSAELPTIVRRLHGVATGKVDREAYRRHLLERYGE